MQGFPFDAYPPTVRVVGERQRITEEVGVVPHHVEFEALLESCFSGGQVGGAEAVVDARPIDHQAAQTLQQVE